MAIFKKHLWTTAFVILVVLTFTLEGSGVSRGREIAFLLILASPFFLLLTDFLNHRVLSAPKVLAVLTAAFLFFCLISTIFSGDKQTSFEYLLLYLSLSLVALSIYNHKDEVTNVLPKLIVSLAFLFSLLTLAIKIFSGVYPNLIPDTGYQLVFPAFGSHNHLGDFLVLAILICIYQVVIEKSKLYWSLLILFIPFFIFSYSRSAYLSLEIILLLLTIHFVKNKLINWRTFKFAGLVFSLALLATLFLATVGEFKNTPILENVHENLISEANLGDKYFLGRRLEFARQAWQSFVEKPFWGIGPGNFVLVSKAHSQILAFSTDSSHNLFLDILSENGIFSLILFLTIIILVFKRSDRNKPLNFLLLTALLLNFQTDYTFRIYGLALLTAILLGVNYQANQNFKISGKLLVLTSIVISILASLIFVGSELSQNNPQQALKLYPLNKHAYLQLSKQNGMSEERINATVQFFPGDPEILHLAAKYYEDRGEKERALEYYMRSYQVSSFEDFNVVIRIYNLKKELEGDESAFSFLQTHFERMRSAANLSYLPGNYRREIIKFCSEKDVSCPPIWLSIF